MWEFKERSEWRQMLARQCGDDFAMHTTTTSLSLIPETNNVICQFYLKKKKTFEMTGKPEVPFS